MTDKIIVRPKCARCQMRARDDGELNCKFCIDELNRLKKKDRFDHYFWGIIASKEDRIYYIRMYHECNELNWLLGKCVKIDLEDGVSVGGIIEKVESVKKPPYESGDVVAVTLKEK